MGKFISKSNEDLNIIEAGCDNNHVLNHTDLHFSITHNLDLTHVLTYKAINSQQEEEELHESNSTI